MKYVKPVELYHQSLKTKGRLIALSVGNQQLGLAISDPSKQDVSTSRVLARTKKSVSALKNLISTYSAPGLIIGYPFFNPFEGRKILPDARVQTKLFVDDLYKEGKFENMNYTFWDATYTTKMIFHSMKETSEPLKMSPMGAHTITDLNAAAEILEKCLWFFKNQASTGIRIVNPN